MSDSRIFLYTSNRMEELAGMLAETLADGTQTDPFEAETVIVQSRGMGRWLSLNLADRHGICQNVRFPFPREAIETVLSGLLPDWQRSPHFRREVMLWRIWQALETYRDDSRFAPIRHYLGDGSGDTDSIKRIQLAHRLAGLFDEYLLYRSDLLLQWEKDEQSADWEALLWREIQAAASEKDAGDHFGHAIARMNQTPPRPPAFPERLPRRLCLFGISSLPPLFLEILRHYGTHREAHLFLLQPTGSYWGDLVSRKKRARGSLAETAAAAGSLFDETGHPLVPSLGRQGQELLNLLVDFNVQQRDRDQRFVAPEENHLLHQLQRDILELVNREEDEASERGTVESRDSSIQVHLCHSPMREAEVLHDQLLALFEKDESLRPRDVLVMIPDIEEYAPYIQAVFGCPEQEHLRIPFSIVDRRLRSNHRVVDSWFRLIEICKGRFPARDIVALLESPPFRKRFRLSDRDVNALRQWIQQTGIRWGIDPVHREEQGLPAIPETTWAAGIQQWLLGYAMGSTREDGSGAFDGIYPFEEIEGGNAGLLDRFLTAIGMILTTRERIRKPMPLAEWSATLASVLEEFFGEIDEFSHEVSEIRSALLTLRDSAGRAAVSEAIPLEAVLYYLEKTIDDTVSSGGFLTGGVTFCTLQPMRTVPARIICLLGMNDGAFPRNPQALGFDRMQDERRPGDRSVRDDDRYLFLETVLSARQTLYLSYTGQSARDLSEMPPSVLLSELLDHLDRAFTFPGNRNARTFLIRRHRLQPFHQEYFGEGSLFSYSSGNAAACRRLMTETEHPAPFFTRKLPPPEPEWKTVPIHRLIQFFRNPAAFFIKERLGLVLPREETLLEDEELFALDKRDEYQLKVDAIRDYLEGNRFDKWQRYQARGQAPLGSPGRAACQSIERKAASFSAKIDAVQAGAPMENHTVDLHLEDFHVIGETGPVYNDTLVLFRPAKVKAKDCTAAWISHLALNAATKGAGITTALIGEDKQVTLPPRDDAAERLGQLLQWYWSGLSQPLPLMPQTAYAYAEQSLKKSSKSPLQAAEKAFLGGNDQYSPPGDIEDPYAALCWKDWPVADVLTNDFKTMAAAFFIEIERFVKGDPRQ